MAAKGDLSVNLCKRYVFGGWYQCGPMQYYDQRMPVSNPVYIISSIMEVIIVLSTWGYSGTPLNGHPSTADTCDIRQF